MAESFVSFRKIDRFVHLRNKMRGNGENMSLFTSFNAGVSGLKSSQSGLNTTAHNFANTKTLGYTRQQNINTDMYYQTLRVTPKSTLQIGYGTTVADIRQIRDLFLDEEYRMEVGRQTFYDVHVTTEQEIEDVLGEMEGVEFSAAWLELWGTIETLSTNQEEITKRELFLSQAEAFLEKATNVYSELKDYQINLNRQIQEQVNTINKIADQIAELNEVIAKSEASGLENANDYRDARNLLLDQLAEYTAYDYYETNGQVCVRVNNSPLIDGTYVNHMKCEKMEIREYDPKCDPNSPEYEDDETKNPNINNADSKGYVLKEGSPMYTVKWEVGNSEVYDIDQAYTATDQSDVGSLLGILTARGKRFGYYTDILQATELQAVKGTPLEQKLLQEYNNTVGNCLLERVEAQFDLMIHKIVTTINDIFAPNVAVTDGEGKTYMLDEAGGVIDPFKVTITDVNGETIDLTKAKVLDVNRCPVGTDDEATPGTEVFSRKTRERYTAYEMDGPIYLSDENGDEVLDANGNPVALTKEGKDADGNPTYTLYVYNDEDEEDRGSLYTVQNLIFNEKLKSDYSYLPVHGNPAEGKTGEYDKELFHRMFASLQVKDITLDPNALAQYGVEDYYQVMVNALGTQGNVWSGILDHQISEVESIEDKRQQISGVATEEEMTFMLMYQHAYNASSRYITVIDQMLEHLIERLG